MTRNPMVVLTSALQKGLEKKVAATGLGVFRIGYGLVALQEIAFLYYFRHLIFDETPYIDPGTPMVPFFLLWWGLAALGLIFGYRTRLAAVVNYIFWVLFTSFTPMWRDFDGGFDQLMIASGLLLIFLPAHRSLALDLLRERLAGSTPGRLHQSETKVPVLAYYLPVFLSLGWLYFDSAIHKLFSEHWRNGMGAWLPSSHPYYISAIDMSWLLEQKWLEQLIGYTIIVFQFVFPFLFWHRRFRVPLLFFGALFHGGITVSLNIYPFGFGMLIHYPLLVPFSWWRRLGQAIRLERPRLKVYYDGQCPLCLKTVIVVEHFDVRRGVIFKDLQSHARLEPALAGIDEHQLLQDLYAVDLTGRRYRGIDTYLKILSAMGYLKPLAWLLRIPGLYHTAARIYRRVADRRQRLSCDEACLPNPANQAGLAARWWERFLGGPYQQAFRLARALVVLGLLQFNSTLHYGLFYRLGMAGQSSLPGILSNAALSFSHAFLGITPHALYLADHFEGYEKIFAITYRDEQGVERWLPFVNRQGRMVSPNWGRVHSMWANIAVTPRIDERRLTKFLTKVTAFWGTRQGLNLDQAHFFIKAKPIRMPTAWEPGLRQYNLNQPWHDAGAVVWKNKIAGVKLEKN